MKKAPILSKAHHRGLKALIQGCMLIYLQILLQLINSSRQRVYNFLFLVAAFKFDIKSKHELG